MICPVCSMVNVPNVAICVACANRLRPQLSNALPHGHQLHGGMFEVSRVLGHGGFGITYLGTFANTGELVAIKEFFPFGSTRLGDNVIPQHDAGTAYTQNRGRFLQEATLLAHLKHLNIVTVYTCFAENNSAYMVMEYLTGRSLEELLIDRGALPENEALPVITRCAEALKVIHDAGLLHRDIKPANIMLTDLGRTVLIDFGSARAFAAGMTSRMTTVLTPGYAPLEQYLQSAHFGPSSDIYALGATLYHMLTGRMPVPSVDRQQGVDVPSPANLNAAVSHVVSNAVMHSLIMKAPERQQSALEFVSEVYDTGRTTPSPVEPQAPAWVARLQQLRQALACEDDERTTRLLHHEPALERLLFGTQVTDLAAHRHRQSRLASLRGLLHAGDDAAIASVVEGGDAPIGHLRPAEQLQVSHAVARVYAVGTLLVAAQGGDPREIVEAWKTAIDAGCCIPDGIADQVRAARIQSLLVPESPAALLQDPPIWSPTRVEPVDQTVKNIIAKQLLRQQNAMRAMVDALKSASDSPMTSHHGMQAIVAAAAEVRASGVDDDAIDWTVISRIERQNAAIERLRAALKSQHTRRIARAWHTIDALYPSLLDPETDAIGRRAFRQWGKELRSLETLEEVDEYDN